MIVLLRWGAVTLLVIGASQSEPHTSESNGGFYVVAED